MSVMTRASSTGSTLGEYGRMWSWMNSERHTPCRVSAGTNLSLKQALDAFDISITEPLLPMLYFDGVQVLDAAAAEALWDDNPASSLADATEPHSSSVMPEPTGVTGHVGASRERPLSTSEAIAQSNTEPDIAWEFASAEQSAALRPVMLRVVSDLAPAMRRLQLQLPKWKIPAMSVPNIALPPMPVPQLVFPSAAWSITLPPMTLPSEHLHFDLIRRLATLDDVSFTAAVAAAAVALELDVESDESSASPGASQPRTSRAAENVVAVIKECSEHLNLGVGQVLVAAGISKSTYSTWIKPGAPKPQLRSQGRLWLLAQAVTSLGAVAPGGVDRWLHADPARVALLLAGGFDELVAEAARQANAEDDSPAAIRARLERQRVAAPAHAAAFALGADGAMDEDEIPVSDAPRIKRGKGKSVSATRRPRDLGPAGT